MNKETIILEKDYDEKRCELNLLNTIYFIWLEKDERKNFRKSHIYVLLNFKNYLKRNYKNIYELCVDHIDNRIKNYYLSRKYLKKWIIKYINKKDPVNTEDLELNIIDNNKYYINYIDFEERKRYLFSENDFKKIVTSSLQNSYEYDIDPEPMSIKNPYTNKEFTKTELRMFNNSVRDMPIIWNMFVDSGFDIKTFKEKYYFRLLEICIPNYVYKLGDLDIVDYLIDIFEYSSIDYCKKCILDRIEIRSRKVTSALVNWINYLKLNFIIFEKTIDDLNRIYSKKSCCHNIDNYYKNITEKDILNFSLDFTKPLFSVGYKTREDKKLYWKRRKEKSLKFRIKLLKS